MPPPTSAACSVWRHDGPVRCAVTDESSRRWHDMIYCVIPEELEGELLEKLTEYYADDDNVTVIVDRRKSERRGTNDDPAQKEQREKRDRRRARVPGEFPRIEPK